ncbi:hypothetical protein FRB99_000901 [Tulasnella sp. 403]|nr:hypothetical protein FRB99_000901 [Tulasnella sp. 403]
MSDLGCEILSLRNQLAEVLQGIPSVPHKAYRPPIIDASRPDEEELEGDIYSIPGLKLFESSIEREIDTLDKYLDGTKTVQGNFSTNAPYFLSVWKEIVAASQLSSIGQTFAIPHTCPPAALESQSTKSKPDTAFGQAPPVKVDVVADEGKTWIRVNTIKNSRIKAEFNDIDSFADSDSEADLEESPILTNGESTTPTNSVIRMASALLAAARAHPVPGTRRTPDVCLRLTRLVPDEEEPRIESMIEELRRMGITLWLGERSILQSSSIPEAIPRDLIPTSRLNLDLSLLVAVVSEITHTPLPSTPEETKQRYMPPAARCELTTGVKPNDKTRRLFAHSRALWNQAEQERRLSLFEEMHSRLESAHGGQTPFTFYASSEARTRLQRIVAKIGGPSEQRRAQALFSQEPDAEAAFWEESRFPNGYIRGLVPIRVFDEDGHPPLEDIGDAEAMATPFFHHLRQTCEVVVTDCRNKGVPEPDQHVPVKAAKKKARGVSLEESSGTADVDAFQRSQVRSPALTRHTVYSLLQGVRSGMTTVTANKASVRAILREMEKPSSSAASAESLLNTSSELTSLPVSSVAALWVVEPRSLAETMRVDETGSSQTSPDDINLEQDVS